MTAADRRSRSRPAAPCPSLRLADFGLSPEARLIDTALDGDRLALTYADGDGASVVIVDLPTMTVVSRLRLTP